MFMGRTSIHYKHVNLIYGFIVILAKAPAGLFFVFAEIDALLIKIIWKSGRILKKKTMLQDLTDIRITRKLK